MADRPIRPSGTTPVSLSTLVTALDLSLATGDPSTQVSGVALSDSAVMPGDLFVALPGNRQHGALFAAAAVEHGAVAVLTDQEGFSQLGDLAVPVVISEHPRADMGRVAKKVYQPVGALPKVLAVTGTNGKTSVAFYLEAICRALGHTTALSNSTERQIAGEVYHTPLTTPEAPELHAMLAVAAERGVSEFALEASAQAIERSRLVGIVAEVSGFTNLSHDHFEDYGDMDNYLRHKIPLFQSDMSKRAVVSLDSEWGEKVVALASVPVDTLAVAGGPPADWSYQARQLSTGVQEVIVRGAAGEIVTTISALGAHMASNAALALVMVHASGVPLDTLAEAVSPENGGIDLVVPGRVEKISGQSPVAVFVDAGRSADAYEKTLSTVREVTSGKLIVVCGTSGNRDRSKRADMGETAARYADLVVVTDDDPRFEDPAQIRADLLAGVGTPTGVTVQEIADPVEAITWAVAHASPGDSIVWMGPGSQPYREVSGVRQPFSARDQARKALAEAGLTS